MQNNLCNLVTPKIKKFIDKFIPNIKISFNLIEIYTLK